MSTRFVTTISSEPVAKYMAELIDTHLDGGRKVLWLLSGGSGIATAVAAHRLISSKRRSNLVIMQIDERYGQVGHADSNWRQLEAAGLKLTEGETAIPILTGATMEATVQEYATKLDQELQWANARIGFFGMGADGHTAGILPGSPAVSSGDLVAGYTGPDFERITITANVIKQLDEAILYAAGEGKKAQLEVLQHNKPAEDQPAQFLKQAKNLTVFNDAIGEAL